MPKKIVPDIVPRFDIVSASENATVHEGVQLMTQANIAALIVVNKHSSLSGILTERDLTQRVLAPGLDAKNILIKEVMTKNPDTVSPDDSPLDAFELMQSRGYRHLPVTENGKCVSIVSIRDLYVSFKVTLEKNMEETEAFVFDARYET